MEKRLSFSKTILFKSVCFQLLFLLSALTASAQTLLDPTFDADGKAMTQIVSINSKGFDSVLQPDGKIVVVGSANANASFPQGYQIAVARYNSDGSLDATFDADGKLTTTPDVNKPSEALAVWLQADGKIIVVGRVGELSSGENPDAVIVRYNSNGSLDMTFDGDGIRIIANFDAQTANDIASDVAVQADGKIIVAASTIASGFQGVVIARLNSDGSFDTNFGTGGYTRTNLGNQTLVTPKIALTADGKTLLTVNAVGAKLIRYNSNGSLDGSFGTGGIINGAGGDSIRLDASGRIVTVDNSSQVNTVVRRYNADGSADTSFGSGGAKSFTFTNATGGFAPPSDLAFQADGKILVGGTIRLTTASSSDFALTRLNADGSIDTLFGFNGQLTTDIQGNDIAHSIFVQPDGKIVLAGESGGGFTIARFNPGALNNTCRPVSDFNGDGKSDLAYFSGTPGSTNGASEWKYITNLNATEGGTVSWGLFSDRLVPADYNGDCRTDFAVFRDGAWYIQTVGSGTQLYYQFGQAGDVPVPGDYDGDDLADAAVFRSGAWYVLGTRNGFFGVQFGQAGDKPVAEDYDGDGKTDIAVYRPSNGTWYIQQSTAGFKGIAFGLDTDLTVQADYDGDGKTDIAVFRPSNGAWYLLQSTAGFTGTVFGFGTDLPVPADYDGDGKADIAVYRDGRWYIQRSTNGYAYKLFGETGAKPIPNAFVR